MSVINDRRGEDILLSLIYPITVEEMSREQQSEFAEASELQLEYMKSSGASVVSEALGDAKVTYAQADGIVVGGQSVCPAAVSKLMKCGLLTRWI
jgi:hypothetical protein